MPPVLLLVWLNVYCARPENQRLALLLKERSSALICLLCIRSADNP